MPHQRIEAGVAGHDGELRARVLLRQVADVERDMEVDRVRAVARDAQVLDSGAERLQRTGQLHRHLVLLLAEEQHDPARTRHQPPHASGLHVLVIDQEDF